MFTMKNMSILSALGALTAGPALAVASAPLPHHRGQSRYILGYARTPGNAFINRHTGKPHEHKREIARRQRQNARNFPIAY